MAKAKKKRGKTKALEFTVVGLQYRLTPQVRRMMAAHVPFPALVEREPHNLHDSNAIKVSVDPLSEIPYKGIQLGYLPAKVAAEWALEIDRGRLAISKATITQVLPEEATAEITIQVQRF